MYVFTLSSGLDRDTKALFGLNELDFLVESTLFGRRRGGGGWVLQLRVEDTRHLTALFGLPVCPHVTYQEMLNEIS